MTYAARGHSAWLLCAHHISLFLRLVSACSVAGAVWCRGWQLADVEWRADQVCGEAEPGGALSPRGCHGRLGGGQQAAHPDGR